MHLLRILPVLLLALLVQVASAQDVDEAVNAAALQSGSYMRSTPPSYVSTNLMVGDVQNFAPEALFDLSPKMWCSAENARFPHVFELELTEVFVLDELVFDNRCENYAGISTKQVRVEVATDASRTPTYTEVGVFDLEAQELNSFSIDPVEARTIRLSILSNHGNSGYTELAEFKAIGTPRTPDIALIDVDGTWSTNWGDVFFDQSGSSVSGSYEYNDGVIRYGGIERNRVSFKWVERNTNGAGWTLLFMNEDGTRMTGVWCHGDDWSSYGFWIMDRPNGVPFVAASSEDEVDPDTIPSELTEKDEAIVREMQATMEAEGRIVLYGINFRTNSADIDPNSHTVLDQIAALMSQDPDMTIRIEGHTDDVGSEDHNRDLSLDRATSTRAYLVDVHGIDEGRMTVAGQGESAPIADNGTEAGRAANRRVEIHRTN